MNRTERYDDPVLANRVRDWMERAAPAAAPERLVFSVMDDVDRSPRRRVVFRGLPILTGAARYAALILVIAIGVAAGIILAGALENQSPPTPPATRSLRPLGHLATDARLLASNANRAWLITSAGQLLRVDADGSPGEPISLTFEPSDLVALANGSPTSGGPETVWLVAPDSDLLRLDPSVGEFVATKGATGARIALGASAAWVSRADEIVKVDSAFMQIQASYAVPGHRAEDPLVVVGNELWVAAPRGIERLDASTGDLGTRIPVSAKALVVAPSFVWAADGSRLVGIDPKTGSSALEASLPTGVSDIAALATHGDVLWVATGSSSGGPVLIAVDPTNGRAISVTPLATAAVSIAVVGNQVWSLDSDGHIDRYAPSS